MADLLDTTPLADKLPITAAFLGAHSLQTEFNYVIAHGAGGILVEWKSRTGRAGTLQLWHVPQCVRLEDILEDFRAKSSVQLIVPRLPTPVYHELLRGRHNLQCMHCHRSILNPPRTPESYPP